MALKQASAIKRGTQQARNAVKELDRQSIEQLLLMYRRAGEDVQRQIYGAADAGDRIPEQRLRALLAAIDEVVDHLGQQRDELLHASIQEAARLGVRPFTAEGVLAVGGAEAVIDGSTAPRIAESAVQFVMAVRQADGLQLSERVWRLNQGAKEALQRAIASAVIRGASAARAAADLVVQGQAIPGDMQQLARGGLAGHVAKLADLLWSPERGEVWKAERVFRTEINRAHGEALMAGAIKTPGFAGIRYLLSPAHPEPDICDLLAAQNIHGLGPGVYPSRELTPWPAHPNTLSFLEIVFADEISDADRAGKETELEALARLAPEIRAGALGSTKAKYFDKGVLSKGMIRAPLHAVERRIQRTGALTAAEIRATPPAEVIAFVQAARASAEHRRIKLGTVGEKAIQAVKRDFGGRDMSKRPRILESGAVRHIDHSHGDAEMEGDRGQVAITDQDFATIQQVALEGERKFVRTKRGSPAYEVTQVVGGYRYELVETVRRWNLAVHTLRKHKT